jgi:hypothetical protein
MDNKTSRRHEHHEMTNASGDIEMHLWGNEVFDRTLADVIRGSRESERAVFLSGVFGQGTAYFVLCLTSDESSDVIAAEDLIEHLLCSPNPILDGFWKEKNDGMTHFANRAKRGAALN